MMHCEIYPALGWDAGLQKIICKITTYFVMHVDTEIVLPGKTFLSTRSIFWFMERQFKRIVVHFLSFILHATFVSVPSISFCTKR